ncbi:MAG: S24/S26 family peptidase [Deltaproteobacteria bacterium]|nr:S24/S26 family peptidase [Deltaproteobacteria bacterium]
MIEALAELARAHLDAGRTLRTRVVGDSMWPCVRAGELVDIAPLSGDPDVGDVVLVQARTTLVLHRVVARAGDLFVTKGDAEPEIDGRVPRERVLGHVPARASRLVARLSRLSGRLGARLLQGVRRRVASLSRAPGREA